MECERGAVDALALEFLARMTFRASDFTPVSDGSCRLHPQLARAVVAACPSLCWEEKSPRPARLHTGLRSASTRHGKRSRTARHASLPARCLRRIVCADRPNTG